jgi:drug/metabolite transporter (DMT)-like permease
MRAGWAPVDERAQHRLGLLLVIGAAAVFSTSGLFTRLIGADAWTTIFWRGAFSGLAVAGYLVWRHRAAGAAVAALAAVGRPGCLVAACLTLGMVSFIAALRTTDVANVAIIYATAPLLTALVAWLWSGERAPAGTLAASLVASAGVVVMVGGAPRPGDLRGALLALVMTLALAVVMVLLRRHREVPMVPTTCLSAGLTALVAWPAASPLSVGAADLGWLVLFGAGQMSLGFVLLTVGSQLVRPVENALVGALDAPLAPLWVWLAFGEVPAPAALVGGAIVLAAVVGHVLVESRGHAQDPRAGGPLEAVSRPSSSRG